MGARGMVEGGILLDTILQLPASDNGSLVTVEIPIVQVSTGWEGPRTSVSCLWDCVCFCVYMHADRLLAGVSVCMYIHAQHTPSNMFCL